MINANAIREAGWPLGSPQSPAAGSEGICKAGPVAAIDRVVFGQIEVTRDDVDIGVVEQSLGDIRRLTAGHGPKTFGAVLAIEHAEHADGSVMKPDHDLPRGLTLDPKTGVLSGTPGEAGRFLIRLTATNDQGVGVSTLLLTVKDR